MPSEIADIAALSFAPAAPARAIARRRVGRQVKSVTAIQLSDCLEVAFGGLVLLGALLFAAGMLRLCWGGQLISSNTLNAGADALYSAGALLGCTVVFNIFNIVSK
jgi:hypothetical protein